MRKKILFLIGGVIATLFLLTFGFSNEALAAEGECHLKHCLVPAPTILNPEQGSVVDTQRPGIKGLTWKTTIVKVYIDGVEQTNVIQIKHEDYYGSFYVEPDYDLEPGIHYAYTIAHGDPPGWYDQSKESIYIYFTVPSPPPLPSPPALPTTPVAPEEEIELDEEITVTEEGLEKQVEIIEPTEEQPTVEVEEGQIEGGVFIEEEGIEDIQKPGEQEGRAVEDELGLQGAAGISDLGEILQDEFVEKEVVEKAKRNRIIGLSVLALIVIFSVIWLVADKQRINRQTEKEKKGDLPPPPRPPTTSKDRAQLEEKKSKAGRPSREVAESDKSQEVSPPPIEPTVSKDNSDRYFASPPPSSKSPYPPKPEDVEYVPLEKDDEAFDPDTALRDIEDRFVSEDKEEQDKLL